LHADGRPCRPALARFLRQTAAALRKDLDSHGRNALRADTSPIFPAAIASTPDRGVCALTRWPCNPARPLSSGRRQLRKGRTLILSAGPHFPRSIASFIRPAAAAPGTIRIAIERTRLRWRRPRLHAFQRQIPRIATHFPCTEGRFFSPKPTAVAAGSTAMRRLSLFAAGFDCTCIALA